VRFSERAAVRVEIARQQLDPSAFDVEVFTNLNRRDFARISEPLDQSGRGDSCWMSRRCSTPESRSTTWSSRRAHVQQMRRVSFHTRYRLRGSARLYEANALTVEAARGGDYENGSTLDDWSINQWLADNDDPQRAMQLFPQVVDEADATGLDVFVDVALNHAGRDVVNAQLTLATCDL
jgi:hypothetical protein